MPKNEIEEMERVMATVIEVAEEGQRDIYAIAEDTRRAKENVEKQLFKLKEEVNEVIEQVDKLSAEEKTARLRLMEVSRNFDKYTEEDIKRAYDAAWQLQVKLSVLTEKEKGLLQRRNDLERQLLDLESVVSRGESMVERLGMVVSLLKGQAETFISQLRVSEQRQVFAFFILKAQEEERHKIARELHDGPAQNMAGLIMKLEYLEHTCQNDTEELKRELALIRQGLRENLADIRRIIFDLRPPQLEKRGLLGCITDYISDFETRYGISVEFQVLGEPPEKADFSETLEFTIFRVIQEALTNVGRHSGARHVAVKFEVAEENVNLIIKDNGCGFDASILADAPTVAGSGYGLVSMRERVALLGGELVVQSSKGKGTRVIAHIPRS